MLVKVNVLTTMKMQQVKFCKLNVCNFGVRVIQTWKRVAKLQSRKCLIAMHVWLFRCLSVSCWPLSVGTLI